VEAWELVRFLHVVALAFFVGGQIMLIVAIVPVLSERDEDIMRAVARRFGLASGVAIAVLLATGIALASHFSRWQDETLQAKLAVLALVGVLTALHIATPYSRAVSLALAGSSLTVVWLGVALTH
jgi:putative copper export protein